MLVAIAAFLPVLWRVFPGMPLLLKMLVAIALLAGYVEHQKNAKPHLSIDEKRTYLFGYACEDVLAELRSHDSTARLSILEVDPALLGREAVFGTVYTLNMEDSPDKDLSLSQGVSGQAVEQCEVTVADRSPAQEQDLRSLEEFGLDKPIVESRRADSNRLPAHYE